MTEINRKKHTGEPTTNGGEFGTHKRDEATTRLDVPPATPAGDHQRLISELTWKLGQANEDAVRDAIHELATEFPDAATGVFMWNYDINGGGVSFCELLDADGNTLEVDSDAENEFYNLGGQINDWERFRKNSSSFAADTCTLDFTTPRERNIPSTFHAKTAMEDAQKLAAYADKQLAQSGADGVKALARTQFPTAATVVIGNGNDGPGSPYFEVIKVDDAAGRTLWDYDDGTDNLADDFSEYAPLIDRNTDLLTKVGNDKWTLAL